MSDKRIMRSASGSNTPAISSSATALAANANRSLWSIQNLGANTLYIRLGADASTSVFHYALKAGSVNDDGTGGSINPEGNVIYTGVITIAGTSPRYTVVELT